MKCVPGFLLELVDGGYGFAFLIPYVYITKVVPPQKYRRVSLVMLGYAEDLPTILKTLNLFPPEQHE